jgi:L-cysteine desulfidase
MKMNSRDAGLLAEAYTQVLNEAVNNNASVYSMLENLYTNLSPDAMTRQGGSVAEELKDIIKEFTEIVSNARRTSDSPDAIQYLLHKLSSD